MEKKKSKKASLENSKAIFLLIGLTLAIAFVTSAFSWQSKKNLLIVYLEPKDVIEVLPKITRNDLVYEETKKEEKIEQEKETEIITNQILLTNKLKKPKKEVIVEPVTTSNSNIYEEPESEPDTIYVYTKNMPKFPGGILALRRWIGAHVNYPAVARESSIQGTVYLRFEVTKTGSIGKIELQKGTDPLLNDEAIKVIKKLPKFKPGIHNGKKVNIWYSIPISFKLN